MRFNWSSRVKRQHLTAKVWLCLGEVVYRHIDPRAQLLKLWLQMMQDGGTHVPGFTSVTSVLGRSGASSIFMSMVPTRLLSASPPTNAA